MVPGSPIPAGYRELRGHAAWAEAGRRAVVLVSGDEAVRFVDGFCTAALARLGPGEGTEAFFPDARGQVLQWGTVVRGLDGVWIDADPGVASSGTGGGNWSLAAHLERYHIRERLGIVDVTDHVATYFLAGPAAASAIGEGAVDATAGGAVAVPDADGRPAPAIIRMNPVCRLTDVAAGDFPGRCAGIPAVVIRGEWLGAGTHLVVVSRENGARLVGRWREAGIVEASADAIDAVRREEGRPAAIDIAARALPQEFGRDDRAISFTKGCYLGQETVARLDALGHVNRRFVGIVAASGTTAGPGATVTIRGTGESVGTITSSGVSPRFGGWLGLGWVRTSALAPSIVLEVAGAEARRVELPPSGGKGAVP